MPSFKARALVAPAPAEPFVLENFTINTDNIPAGQALVRFIASGSAWRPWACC